jgi:trimethylamine-N-oxide reductase cytochrome c-type subunit TorC
MAYIPSFSGVHKVILSALIVFSLNVLATTKSYGESVQDLYVNTLTTLRDPKNGEVIASVPPGTALHVLSQHGDDLEVEITGWSPTGGEKYMFIDIGQRINVAMITDKGLPKRVSIGEKSDDYDSVWEDVSIRGLIAKKDVAKNVTRVWREARRLFHKRCTRCHALHRPTEFTANQWPSILKIMTVRAGLTTDKKALVTQYIQNHAKDQKGATEEVVEDATDAAQSEDTPPVPAIVGDAKMAKKGGALFMSLSCNACHGDDAKTPANITYPKLGGQNADYILKQMQDFKSGTRANDEDHMMKDTLGEIPEDDLIALAYWLSTQ